MPPFPSPQPKAPTRRGLQAAATAFVLIAGIAVGAGISGFNPFAATGDPDLSDREVAERAAVFAAAGPIALPEIPQAERGTALDGMDLAASPRRDLAREVDAGHVRLVTLELWDDRAEDGDRVRVTSAGYSREVTIRHVPVQLAVPVAAGGRIELGGLFDGGGGITIALKSNGRTVPLPRLRVGSVVPVPVR